MVNASNSNKAYTLVNCLDSTSRDIIVSQLGEKEWTYPMVKDTVLQEFGGQLALANRKMEFINSSFKRDKSLTNFAT